MRTMRSISILGAVIALVLGLAPAAFAGTDSAYNYGNCLTNSNGVKRKLNVYAEIRATDHGGTVKINPGTMGYAVVKSCDGNTDFAVNKSMKLTIVAHGWGVDCGVGLPGSVSCGSSGGEKAIVFDTLSGGTPVYLKREVSSAESVYFSDGTVGDTSKVCATVSGVLWGYGTSATACTNV